MIESVLIGGFLLTSIQLWVIIVQHNKKQDWNRRLAAESRVCEFETKSTRLLTRHLSYRDRNSESPYTADEIEAKVNELDKSGSGGNNKSGNDLGYELRAEIHTLLNFYEGLARGIDNRVYDERIIKDAYRGNIVGTFHVFAAYLKKRRNLSNNLLIWKKFEDLARKWDREDNGSPAKPRPST